MLNLSYHEFQLLTFLTPSTVSNILTGTDSSLISKFFSLEVLSTYDSKLREERKLLTRDKKILEAKLMEETNKYSGRSVKEMNNVLHGLNTSMANIYKSKKFNNLPNYEQAIIEARAILDEANFKERETLKKLKELRGLSSKCPTCGHDLSGDTTSRVTTISSLEEELNKLNTDCALAEVVHEEAQVNLKVEKEPIELALSSLKKQLHKAEAEHIAASIITEKEEVDTDKILEEITDKERKIYALANSIEAIKSGEVHKAYLTTFTGVLNTRLGKLKENLNLSMRILAKISSSGLSFSILDDGIYKDASILSAGEKVIVGLVVLSAMFETLEDTLNIHISTIMLDEAIGAVSKVNMEVITKVIKNISSNRCVIVTQHHEELSEDIFDTLTIVVKIDGLTEIKEMK